MSRTYLVFGSTDGNIWTGLGSVVSGSVKQALAAAAERSNVHFHFAAVPERNWSAATPEVVERKPLIKWTDLNSPQLTVQELLEDPDKKIVAQPESPKETVRNTL